MKTIHRGLIAAIATLPMLTFTHTAHAVPVGLELSLLIDVSGSVDGTEFALQRNGYVQAFQSSAVQNAILTSDKGSIAVNFIQWSADNQHVQSIGYTLIDSVASANAFATTISTLTRAFSDSTAIGSAINFATPLFASNAFEGDRLVIDISGDGASNDGADTATARNNALAAGVNQINGLPILGEAGLLAYYNSQVRGGTGSFVTPANSFTDFATAIQNKLVQEIGPVPVPEPTTLALLEFGIAGLIALRRRSA